MTALLRRWWHGVARLFVVRTKFEAFMLIYAIATARAALVDELELTELRA